MSNSTGTGIEDLLDLFKSSLDAKDLIEAKLMSKVALAITKERLRLKMSQTQFAKYLGVQQSMVSRWEQGDYNFTIKKISEIAAKLNIDVGISFSNIDTITTFKHLAKTAPSNNIYSFNEYKDNAAKFKRKYYTEKGWGNVAVH